MAVMAKTKLAKTEDGGCPLHGYTKNCPAVQKLQDCINQIEAVACGEEQIQADGVYDDSDGLQWIYKRIQSLKESDKNSGGAGEGGD